MLKKSKPSNKKTKKSNDKKSIDRKSTEVASSRKSETKKVGKSPLSKQAWASILKKNKKVLSDVWNSKDPNKKYKKTISFLATKGS